jgi:hypothetical protein
MVIKDSRHYKLENGLQLHGFAEKTKIVEKLPAGRKLATLSDAASIIDNNCYWICAHSREIEPRSVNGSGYTGRTFEGIPAEEGHYLINNDNTFTKLNEKEEADWSQRLYVSAFAASEAARGEGTAILYVMRNMTYFPKLDNVLSVFTSYTRPSNSAIVASVPERDQKELDSIATEVMRK